MALTLHATLNAAQNGTTHKPILKILSSDWAGEIPFDGTPLKTTTTDEYGPASIVHSSGRVCALYYDGSGYITYYYTDTERVTWSSVRLAPPDYKYNVALVELANGDIGVVFRNIYNTIRYFIITVTGQIAVTWTTIFDETDGIFMSGPTLFKTAAGDYMILYSKYVSGDLHYHFFTRTSSNFTSWSAETEISIGGLTVTKKVADPMVLRVTTGELLLFFSYMEIEGDNNAALWNIYYSKSADNGATWGNAIKVTNYTSFSVVGIQPYAAQKQANELILAFTEKSGSLVMVGAGCGGGYGYIPHGYHWDPVERVIYVNAYSRGVWKLDVDTWEILQCWDKNTTPGLSVCWDTHWGGFPNQYTGDGPYFGVTHNTHSAFVLVNGRDNWVREYYMKNLTFPDPCGPGIKNVTGFVPHYRPDDNYYKIRELQVDESDNKIWVTLQDDNGSILSPDWCIHIGYFELSDTGPTYTYHEVWKYSHLGGLVEGEIDKVTIHPGQNLVLALHWGGFWRGHSSLLVFDLTTGGLIKNWNHSTHPDFPAYAGKVTGSAYNKGFVYDPTAGKIYMTFEYTTELDQGDRRGLAIVDYLTERTAYERPTYATYDDYWFQGININNAGEVLLTVHENYMGGIVMFDPTTLIWTLYDNSTWPGLFPNNEGTGGPPFYDEQEGLIYAKTGSYQIIVFSRYGYIQQSKYKMGTYATSWAFGGTSSLVQGFIDYDPAVVYDAVDGGLYAFWVNQVGTEFSIKWDKEISNFNLVDYILAGSDVVITRSIDGNPATLDFTVARGHLFDTFNQLSLWRTILSKGRRITVQQGEKVADVEYWQNLGTFVIMERSMTYKKGEYPAMTVRAECRSGIWRENIISATAAYTNYPEDIIKDIVVDFTDMILADMILPTFVDRVTIHHSWIDTSVWDIVMQLCHRFCYYPRFDVDGKLTARLISNANAIAHTYSNTTKLIDVTPDDSFSDYTNRIIVSGQELDYVDVLYPEERVGYLSGTVGWWSGGKSYTVYYSEDKEKRVLNPRLDVKDSVTSIIGELAGGTHEEISEEDPEHHYVKIHVDTRDLTGLLIALLGTTGLIWMSRSTTDAPGLDTPGHIHARMGTWVTDALLFAALNIMASVSTFQYEIFGQPIGEVRRSIQCEPAANDLAMQEIYGMVVEKKIDDPLCYTVVACNKVAVFELLIVQLQRKRIKFSKVTHLQDEEGDTIRIVHPYSGGTVTVFITDLVRKMMIPGSPDSEGYWIDEIEGWVLD